MGLLDDLTAPEASECMFAGLLGTLPAEERAAVVNVIEQIRSMPRVQGRTTTPNVKWLWRILSNNGHKIGVNNLTRHVRQECSCR